MTAKPMNSDLFATFFQTLLIHAGDEGRAEALFGESYGRVRQVAPPFIIGGQFPSVYLEFPLAGDRF